MLSVPTHPPFSASLHVWLLLHLGQVCRRKRVQLGSTRFVLSFSGPFFSPASSFLSFEFAPSLPPSRLTCPKSSIIFYSWFLATDLQFFFLLSPRTSPLILFVLGHQGGVAFGKNPAGKLFLDWFGENLVRTEGTREGGNLGWM